MGLREIPPPGILRLPESTLRRRRRPLTPVTGNLPVGADRAEPVARGMDTQSRRVYRNPRTLCILSCSRLPSLNRPRMDDRYDGGGRGTRRPARPAPEGRQARLQPLCKADENRREQSRFYPRKRIRHAYRTRHRLPAAGALSLLEHHRILLPQQASDGEGGVQYCRNISAASPRAVPTVITNRSHC